MLPASPSPYVTYLHLGDAVAKTQSGARLFRREYLNHLLPRKRPASVGVAPRRDIKPYIVGDIFRVRTVHKVIRSVVESIPVIMADNMARRAWSVEGSTNKSVNVEAFLPIIPAKFNDEVPRVANPRLYDLRAEISFAARRIANLPSKAPDTAKVRHLVKSNKVGYGNPDFGGIIDISHGAVPSRGGQGRTVFAAPIRPAFYGANPPKSKGSGLTLAQLQQGHRLPDETALA